MKYLTYLSILGPLLFIFNISNAQERNIIIPLHDISDIKESKGSPLILLGSDQVWESHGRTDSVLWTVNLVISNSKVLSERFLPVNKKLLILTKRNGNNINLEISRKKNPFLKKSLIYSYPIDSLNSWTLKTIQDDLLEKIKLDLEVFDKTSGENIQVPWEAFLVPFSIGMKYNDKRLNEMPLAVKIGFNKKGNYLDHSFYISKDNWLDSDSLMRIIVYSKNNPHTDKTENNIVYKNLYSVKDSIFLDGTFTRIDSISNNMENLYLSRIEHESSDNFLPNDVVSGLLKYFDENSNYLLLDFWGSWCIPCVENLPSLKAAYTELNEKISFLGICFDKASNFPMAKEILKTNKINWDQVYIDMDNNRKSLVNKLNVSIFPTYIIINRKGRVIFRNSTDGFAALKTVLMDLNNN